MKGTKGSSVSYSFLYITDSEKPDEKKKILFPSNYNSLLKSVNYLYKDKFVVRSIYTSDGDLVVGSTDNIRPGMLLYVSSKEPREPQENKTGSKTVSLYSPDKELDNQSLQNESKNNYNKMSKERKQTYNHLFGLTSQNNNQPRTKSNKQSKNNTRSRTSKKNDKSNAAPKFQRSASSEINDKQDNESANNIPIKSKKQREKSIDSFNSASENQKKTRKTSKANDNNDNYNSNENILNNKYNNNTVNNDQSNQQVVRKVPSNLYTNTQHQNHENDDQFGEADNNSNIKDQNVSNEFNDQENDFAENDNLGIDDNSSNLNNNYNNNEKYYYGSTSETRDGGSMYRNDNFDNDEDETNLCRIATELTNEDSFAGNIKSSLELLDDEVQSRFLRSGQTLETNQRNYWYLRCLQYMKEQNTAQHGNYMFSYDSMVQFVKDFVAQHRFIIYPISNLKTNHKQNNKENKANNNSIYADDSSIATAATNTTNATNATNATTTTTNNNNSNLNCDQIHYWIKTKSAICGPRKSGKSTLLSMMAEQIITEAALNGSWKRTVFYMLDMEECGPLFDDFKSLYIFFIEFSLKAIILQRPELIPHFTMLVKFFSSIFDYTNAPKLKKIFSSKPQFQKFALNCENLMVFYSQMWNNQDSHFLFYNSIFQIPSLLASAAGIDTVFIFVDNIEYINTVVQDDLESGQEFNVYDAFSLLLERVNYIVTCEEQTEMFDSLDNKTELISTFQLNAKTQYENTQIIVEYEYEETENSNRRKRRNDREVPITQPQKMTLNVSYCGDIPAFVSLWEEINAVADEIDEAVEKENQKYEEEDDEKFDDEENNKIDELYEAFISLVQHFVNDLVIDNERDEKIKVNSVRRTSK